MTSTVCRAQYRLVRFAAFPLRLDVQANTSHPQNDEVDGIVPTLAGWGGKTAARGSGMEDGRAVHPPKFYCYFAGSVVVRMFGTSEV